ncbi:hypothetical protein MMC06_001169 [Schaereria dolodes]|nr:hypothetical protein [Schaereria dolodes]
MDLLLCISFYFSPSDVICCRRVSKSWQECFTNPYFLRTVLIRNFPEAREVRALGSIGLIKFPLATGSSRSFSWVRTFDNVAARYQALYDGRPRSVSKIRIGEGDYCPVRPWDRRFRSYVTLNEPELNWTYDCGLLVYLDPETNCYVLVGIESKASSSVTIPFDMTRHSRSVRRIRLIDGILIFEWSEKDPLPSLGYRNPILRHSVTAFDIAQQRPSQAPDWSVSLRGEWNLHPLGLNPEHDRFFSTHNATHYVVYTWTRRPAATMTTANIKESIEIWNFQQSPPKLIKRFKESDLDYYDIRQRSTPLFWKIEIDERMIYVVEDGCRELIGSDVGTGLLPTTYYERVVGIPIIGYGPSWEDNGGPGASTMAIKSLGPRRATCRRYEGSHPSRIKIREFRGELAQICISVTVQARCDPQSIWIEGKNWGPVQVQQNGAHINCRRFEASFGEERWLIGEDNVNRDIMILRFDKTETRTGRFPKRQFPLQTQSLAQKQNVELNLDKSA